MNQTPSMTKKRIKGEVKETFTRKRVGDQPSGGAANVNQARPAPLHRGKKADQAGG